MMAVSAARMLGSVAPCLDAMMDKKWGSNQCVDSGQMVLQSKFWNGNDIAESLTTTSNQQRMPDKNRMQMVVQPMAFPWQQGGTLGMSGTLVKNQTMAVAYGLPGNWIGRKPENGGNAVELMHNLSPNLTSTDRHAVSTPMQVRRLTPVECERLQGFPDGYTDIQIKGKPTPDGPRYKALGNSMAVPVMKWIGKRIKQVEEL